MPVATVEMLKTEMGIPTGVTFHDLAMQRCVNAANGWVRGQLPQNGGLAVVTQTEYPKVYGPQQRTVTLMGQPILSVVAVTNGNWRMVEGTDFRIDAKAGMLIMQGASINAQARNLNAGYWSTYPDAVQVTYAFGYTAETVPNDLLQATVGLATSMWRRGKFSGVESENVEGHSIKLTKSMIPDDVWLVLAQYTNKTNYSSF